MGTRDNESMGLTRRGFLTGALALGAVGAGSMLAGCSSEGGAGKRRACVGSRNRRGGGRNGLRRFGSRS